MVEMVKKAVGSAKVRKLFVMIIDELNIHSHEQVSLVKENDDLLDLLENHT